MAAMPEGNRAEDVEKVLAEEKAVVDRKKRLVAYLLKRREAACKDFDGEIAKLGRHSGGNPKRKHHRNSAPPAQSSPKDKANA